MNLKNSVSFLSILWMLLVLAACSSKKKIVDTGPTAEILDLTYKMKLNEIDFSTFSTKADFSLETKKKTKLKATIRIQKDSVIWVSVTPFLGIEVARAMITPDSVKVIDRINKKYFIEDISSLSKKLDLNINLDFETLQALLIGNSIPYDITRGSNYSIDGGFHHLSELKRSDNENINLWVSAVDYKVNKFTYSDIVSKRFLEGKYSNFVTIEEQLIPEQLEFEFKDPNSTAIEINYSRVSLNKSLNFEFNISSKYERVVY